MKRWWAGLSRQAFFVVMALGALFITLTSLAYFDADTLAPFVIEKLPVRFETLWLFSLKVHVASAIVSFPLCLVLMTRWIQRRKTWHRWLGRITGALVVGALVPTGVVLSLEAKGGAPVTVGFLLSAAIVLWGMIYGVHYARQKQLAAHARAMRHVVAQMSVAVTSRAMLIGFDFTGLSPDTAYLVALWIPVMASALVAEWVSGRLLPFKTPFFNPSTRSLS